MILRLNKHKNCTALMDISSNGSSTDCSSRKQRKSKTLDERWDTHNHEAVAKDSRLPADETHLVMVPA